VYCNLNISKKMNDFCVKNAKIYFCYKTLKSYRFFSVFRSQQLGRVANQLPPSPPERKCCSSAENLENIYQSVTARKHSRGGSFERAAVHLGKTSCEWEKVWQEPPPPFGEITSFLKDTYIACK